MNIQTEMYRLIEAAEGKKIQLRAIGGLAIHVHNHLNHPLFLREYADLDFVVAKKQRREFEAFMPEAGYKPHRQFNVLNGDQRQIYYHNETDMKIDIFVGDFMMCHKIPLETRLKADPITIPLAELLLSKAQIFHLNRKDALDLASLLLNKETGNDDTRINLDVIASLCGADWGLYKTVSLNLEKVKDIISKEEAALKPDERASIIERTDQVLKTFEVMPKNLAWQMRDKVGTRVRWYEEVEEVSR